MQTKSLQLKRTLSAALFVLLLSAEGLMKLHAQNGTLNGVFTVNANGDQVYFSQGNLQYQASTNTWRFAENQWDYVGGTVAVGTSYERQYGNVSGSDNTGISESYDGWIDLFGWGTSGHNHGAVCYQPWEISQNRSDYYAYGLPTYNLNDSIGQADWGYSAISNGGNMENSGWHTLTKDEWDYMLNTRSTASGIRWARGTVNDVFGIIILPDNWTASIYWLSYTNVSYSEYDSNIITAEGWTNTLEPNGAVFLPAAGFRYGTSFISASGNIGAYRTGMYWSASRANIYSSGDNIYGTDQAYEIDFDNGWLRSSSFYRYEGLSVRLVRPVQNATSYIINAISNPEEGGMVSGTGSFDVGSTCTLTAIPNQGYTFFNWTENDEVVSTDSIYAFQVTSDRQLTAVFANSHNNESGLLNGVFSVSANTQVNFSQGNLQYQASTNTWRFAENQWEFVGGNDYNGYHGNVEGSSNNDISSTYSGWIDLFGWGTSGYDHGAVCYQPWGLSQDNSHYYAYGSSTNNLYDQTGQADWGYNPISNGGNFTRQWKTLSQAEWNYLLFERTTLSGLRYVRANVNGVNGLVLLPDNWSVSIYALNGATSSNYSNNNISASDWTNVLEANGAVFLPNTGYRYVYSGGSGGGIGFDDDFSKGRGLENNWMYYYENGNGNYWTASNNNNSAYCLRYYNYSSWYSYTQYPSITNVNRYEGYPVRLVHVIPQCNVIFNLYDLNGYGWHGASLNVSFSDGSPSQSFTIESSGGGGGGGIGEPDWKSSSRDVYSISIGEGVRVTLTWVSGYCCNSDCSFSVSYEDGEQIYQASNPSSGLLYEFDCNCAAEPSLQVTPNSLDLGQVALYQSASSTINVSGTMLENGLDVRIIGDDASMFSFTTAEDWNEYSGGELTITFTPTIVQSDYHAMLVISSGTLTQSVALSGSFANIYVFNTFIDEDVYPMNTAIPIHGTVTDMENDPVVNLEVEIGVTVMGWKRTMQVITNENGQFAATFEPLPLESGYYTVNSGWVGNNSTEVHDSFDILGMTVVENTLDEELKVVDNYWLLCDVTENVPKTGHVQVINNNSVALTNIQVTVLSAPSGCEITFMPSDLEGFSEGYLTYSALGTITTQGYEYQEVRLKATCDQGAETTFTMWFYCEEAWGSLEVFPKALTTSMTRGKNKTINVMLTNNGPSTTGEITINLPNTEWMSVLGGTTLPSIPENGSATLTLRLSPGDDVPLGQIAGTIGIGCEHGDGASLPYFITTVSEESGALVVDVIDEFTTNTNNGNGPHVEGAEVTLIGYYSHDTVAHGYTGMDGVFSIDTIDEGFYTLNVQAKGHSGYENNIYINAGVTKEENVFMQYQGVTYSWLVEPTEIPDEYSIVLNMEYEVDVPIPVITLLAPQSIPDFEDAYTFSYIIINHGLVDAHNLTLYTPENEYYEFTALYDHIDMLQAQSSVEIPCVVTHKSNLTIGCGVWALSLVRYSYFSGEELMYNHAIAYTLLSESASCNQNLPPLGGDYGGYGGSGSSGGGGSAGGSGAGGGSGNNSSSTGGHGAPTHPGHGGNSGSASVNYSTPVVYNQIPSIDVKVGVQFFQTLTMTREAFIGTFAVRNGHATDAVTGIGLDFIIKNEEGNDCTGLFQISTISLDGVTGIDGDGTLAAGLNGMVKILFIPTPEAAPIDSMVYSFGGNFTFVDPWNSVTRTLALQPTYLTVHPSPDLYIDYFVAPNVYGDNPLTSEEEPMIPAELAVRVWNKGAGTAKNVVLESAQPVVISYVQGLPVDFDLYGTFIDGIGVQVGLDSIVFGNISSGETKVGEWLFISSQLAHLTSCSAHVIHNGSYGNRLSLVSHVGIHELTHPIYSQNTRTNGIHDFLVNDIPDENNYPDSIYFSNGGKTSVSVAENISFDNYVTNHDTIVILTVNPSRIGWNYGETEDPGRNRYELLRCIRNHDNKVIPLSNVWQEAMIVPNSGDTIYENKLRIVDTVSSVQTVTYTLVYAGIPIAPPQSPIGAIDGLFSVSDSQKVYFSQGNLQYQASTDTWRFATNQYDYVGEYNANISQTYDGWIDLFGWGTSGWDNGNTYYHPWDINADNDGTLFGPTGLHSLVGAYANADWGVYNPISNGGNQANLWRSLTYWEWKYLLDTRVTSSGVRYAKAQVNDVNGLVLVPDNWDTSIYELQDINTSTASFDSNVIGLSDWENTFESNGAVFLPAAGVRFNGTRLFYLNSQGAYWFSTCNGNNAIYATQSVFSNDGIGTYSGYRSTGLSVRLVKTAHDNNTCAINTTSSPVMGGTVTGAGTYNQGEICTLTATANNGCVFDNWTKNGVIVSTDAIYSFTVMENATYVANFSVNEFRFITAGNWSDVSNWLGLELPTPEDEAFVDALCYLDQNVEVAALAIAGGQTLTIQSGKTLTVPGDIDNTSSAGLVIEDGAQLVHDSENVMATVKKYIMGYDTLVRGRFCVISNPLTMGVSPETVATNLTNGNYDLYEWLAGSLDSLEWRNYKNSEGGNFDLLPGLGYLYANQDNIELSFQGVLNRSDNRFGKSVNQVSGESFHYNGWNLIGNPFACDAYLVDEDGNSLPYYRMNAAGRGFEAVVSGAIAPMEGIFYEASENGYVYFTRTAPAKEGGLLTLSVSQDGDVIDNVIICFGEGNTLKKLSFNEKSDRIYIEQDGEDYAVVSADGVGEMPVSFKAEKNGSYTLSFSIENVEFGYLHLIDTLTGEDVDLLDDAALRPHSTSSGTEAQGPQGPVSYTFEAKATDIPDRFKLLFR